MEVKRHLTRIIYSSDLWEILGTENIFPSHPRRIRMTHFTASAPRNLDVVFLYLRGNRVGLSSKGKKTVAFSSSERRIASREAAFVEQAVPYSRAIYCVFIN